MSYWGNFHFACYKFHCKLDRCKLQQHSVAVNLQLFLLYNTLNFDDDSYQLII